MFYRIGKIKCKPGKSNDVISYFKSKEDFFSETKGIISLSYFKSGQDEVSGIAIWESKEAFIDWTKSDAFKLAHKNAGAHKDLYLGPPNLETFDQII